MKKLLIILAIIVLVVLFGTWPLFVLSKIVEWLATGIRWLAKALDWFDWNGLLN